MKGGKDMVINIAKAKELGFESFEIIPAQHGRGFDPKKIGKHDGTFIFTAQYKR